MNEKAYNWMNYRMLTLISVVSGPDISTTQNATPAEAFLCSGIN